MNELPIDNNGDEINISHHYADREPLGIHPENYSTDIAISRVYAIADYELYRSVLELSHEADIRVLADGRRASEVRHSWYSSNEYNPQLGTVVRQIRLTSTITVVPR